MHSEDVDYPTLAKDLHSLLNQVAPALPADRVRSIRELIVIGGEYGVALEILCDNIMDFDIKLTQATHERIRLMATRLKIPESYWRMPDVPSGDDGA